MHQPHCNTAREYSHQGVRWLTQACNQFITFIDRVSYAIPAMNNTSLVVNLQAAQVVLYNMMPEQQQGCSIFSISGLVHSGGVADDIPAVLRQRYAPVPASDPHSELSLTRWG